MEDRSQISRAKRNALRFLIFLKRLVQSFAALIILFLIFFLLLNSSTFLNWSKSRILSLLKEEIENRIEYTSLDFNFFNGAEIKDLIIYDHHDDSLFYSKVVKISFAKSLASLLKNELSFNKLELKEAGLCVVKYSDEEENSFDIFLKQFKKKNSSSGNKLDFDFNEIDLQKFEIKLLNQRIGNEKAFNLDKASLKVKRMDLRAGFADIDRIEIENPKIKFIQIGKDSIKKDLKLTSLSDSLCRDLFALSCSSLVVKNAEFIYSTNTDFSLDSMNKQFFNPKKFKLSELQLEVSNFNLDGKDVFANKIISSTTVNDFLSINSLNMNGLRFLNDEISIPKFNILTDDSHLGDSLSIYVGNQQRLDQILNEAYLQLYLRDTRISCKDLLFFIPRLRENNYLKRNTELYAELVGSFSGTLNNLKVFDFAIDIPNKLEFKGDIHTHDITQRGEELVNLDIKHLVSSSEFIQEIIPALSKVQIFDKIGSFKYKGRFDGFIEDFVSDGTFYSELGILESDIRLNIRPGTDKATWSGELKLNNFALGRLLNSTKIGNINMNASIKDGLGLHIDRMSADLKADIYSIDVNNYNYQNLHIDAKINKDLFDGEATIKDKNLDVVFKGRVSEISGIPKLNFTSEIAKADLKALNLSDKSYIISAIVKSDLTDLDFDKITGSLKLSKSLIYDYQNNRVIHLGDVTMNQSRNGSMNITNLSSDILDLEVNGEYKLTTAYNQVFTFLHDQYPEIFSDIGLKYTEDRNPLKIVGQIDVKSINKVSTFLDWKIKSDYLQGNFKIDNIEKVAIANLRADKILFKNIVLEKINGNLLGDPNHFDGHLVSDRILLNDKVFLRNAKVLQNFENSVMRFKISANDTNNLLENYRIHIASEKSGSNKKFYFEGEDIVVNGYPWQYDKNASFEIGREYIALNNFHFFDSTSEVKIKDIENKGVQVDVKSFDLALINPLLKSPSLSFSGRYDLSVQASNVFKLDKLDGDMQIINMRINKVNYGRFAIGFVMIDPKEPWKINVKNQYKETDIDVSGSINLPLTSDYSLPKFDFVLSGYANGFQLYFLESFITNISKTTGTLTGPVKVYRENKKVYLDGDFVSSESSTHVNYLNTTYRFDKQKIKFYRNEIIFDNNTLYDELNNPILANGKMTHDNLTTFTLNIDLSSKKALILNTKRGDNPHYYGHSIMSFLCSFRGPTNKIDMDFNGRSEKGTNFVIPVKYDQESPDTKFVRFRAADTIANLVTSSIPVVIKGMNVKMDIELTEDCEMSIIFDEKNGDILKGNGNGNIQIASLRDNTFTVKGNYVINSGQYLFTLLNIVNKPFKLKKGGTIVWTGDPINANINMEASYDGLNISPANLISEYIGNNPTLSEEAKERTRVDLSMIMKGSLLKPDIGFKIGFPYLTGQLRNFTDAKIRVLEQNPQQMNQQVAFLIIFRTFQESNTNFGSNIISGNATLNTGVKTISEFLSNQVSIFVSNLLSEVYGSDGVVSGVDVNLNVDPNRTILGAPTNSSEVVFNVKHHLWNDEWAVSIGANFGNNSTLTDNQYFNPESSIEWNTPVNGLKMRIYYRSVEGIDAFRQRVGIGVNYRKEFNSLSDMKKFLKENNKSKEKKSDN